MWVKTRDKSRGRLSTSSIGASNWPNVNKAIPAFKTEDQTLTKIIKFIPNIIKLIAAVFIDVSNKAFTIIWTKPKEYLMENKQDTTQDTSKSWIVEKVKNIWTNHKGKISFSIVSLVGLGSYFFFTKYVFQEKEACPLECVEKSQNFLRKGGTGQWNRWSSEQFESTQCTDQTETIDKGSNAITKIKYTCKTLANNVRYKKGDGSRFPGLNIIGQKNTTTYNLTTKEKISEDVVVTNKLECTAGPACTETQNWVNILKANTTKFKKWIF